MLTDHAIFKDGEYIVDYDEDIDVGEENGLEKAEVQFIISCARRAGDDDANYEWIEVNAQKIKNKMGLD